MRTIIVILIILYANMANAGGVNSELTKMFNSLGSSANITKPGSFKDQSGGYYTGGSLFVRNQVRNTQLFNITPPSFSAGCGGIDIYTGGFSYLNKDALINALKTIGSNAKSYAFNLALQTMTPQIYNTLNELNALSQEINNMNINSCEAAATMVGSVWPKSDTSSRYLCSAMGTHNNRFSDWVEARQGCGKDDNRNSNVRKDSEFKDILGDEFNLAWIALRKNQFLSTDRKLAEFFMSISGTIISKKDGKGKFKKSHVSSLAKNSDFIQALVTGEKGIEVYNCTDPENCLNVKKNKITIRSKEALKTKVEDLLRSMSHKVLHDEKISDQEMALVRSSTIPIFKVLSIQVAFKKGSSPLDIMQFSESIAYDLLLKYLEEVLDIVDESLREFGAIQIDDSSVESLKREASNTRKILLDKRNSIYQQMHHTLSVINHSKQIEQQLHNMFIQTNGSK